MLHFCDGFDSYTNFNDLLHSKWGASLFDLGDWTWSANEGINGGGCLKHVGANAGDVIGTLVDTMYSSRAEFRTLFWFKIATPPAEQLKFFQWTERFWMVINPDGTFEIQGFIPQSFSVPARYPIHYVNQFDVCDNEWHCLEIAAYTFTNTVGRPASLRVGLDDFVVFDDELADVTATSSLLFYFYSIGVDTWIDDVIIWDEAGSNPVLMPWGEMTDTRADEFIWDWYNEQPVNGDLNNFPERGQDDFFYWMGARQITTLRPASDGLINDFNVVGAATKIDAVDDLIPEAGKFLTENQVGSRMLFNFDDFPHDRPVYSVVVNSRHVMADFGSIVGHAEALVAPDFNVGVRRRISGNYKFVPDIWSGNLAPNSGGPFVNTDNWNVVGGTVEIVDGQLKFSNVTVDTTTTQGVITSPIAVTAGEYYYLRLKRGPALDPEDVFQNLYMRVCRNADGTQNINFRPQYSADIQLIAPDSTRLIRFRAPQDLDTGIVYIRLSTSSAIAGRYSAFSNVVAFPELHKWEFRHYQWAFRHNPTTDAEWDQAGINAAEFGMRIAP